MWENQLAPEAKSHRLQLALHYHLYDDSLEIIEVHRRNSGRDPFPILLSRRKLPKSPSVPPVGE